MNKYKIPQRANVTQTFNLIGRNGNDVFGRILEWEASKGYQTDFMEIKHYAFQIMIGEIFKTIKVTTNKKKYIELLKYWETIKK